MIQDGVFFVLAAIVLLGAFLAVTLRNVFHNALGLGLSLFGMAGIFIYLNSEFLAAMQVIIYVGAIAIAIIFAIMLSQPMWLPLKGGPSRLKTARSLAVSVLFFAVLSRILLGAKWPQAAEGPADYSVGRIGELLLNRYLVPFELISLVLLVAIMGALVISREKA